MAVDRSSLRWMAWPFIPWLAVLNLVWEAAHLPLYTLWREASAAYLVFSVLHCTLGDVLIGTLALLACLVVLPARQDWQTVCAQRGAVHPACCPTCGQLLVCTGMIPRGGVAPPAVGERAA